MGHRISSLSRKSGRLFRLDSEADSGAMHHTHHTHNITTSRDRRWHDIFKKIGGGASAICNSVPFTGVLSPVFKIRNLTVRYSSASKDSSISFFSTVSCSVTVLNLPVSQHRADQKLKMYVQSHTFSVVDGIQKVSWRSLDVHDRSRGLLYREVHQFGFQKNKKIKLCNDGYQAFIIYNNGVDLSMSVIINICCVVSPSSPSVPSN